MNATPIDPATFLAGAGLGLFAFIAFVGLFALALFAFWIWMLIDCAQAPAVANDPNQRVIWILILVFAGWLGALLYYFFIRRPRLAASQSTRFTSPPFRQS